MKKCHCGEPDCWDDGDYTWLDSQSGWRGTVAGCGASVYFVHGKKIAEERHLPEFSGPLDAFIEKLREWSSGLSNPWINWSHDTGGGDAGFWLRDVRDPQEQDWTRLAEVRQRKEAGERIELERLSKKYGVR